MVRSTTTREAEWTEQDLAEVSALAAYRATLCPCCGLPKSMVQVHERDIPKFVVTPKTCWARKTMSQAQLAVENDKKISDAHKRSLQWSITVKE